MRYQKSSTSVVDPTLCIFDTATKSNCKVWKVCRTQLSLQLLSLRFVVDVVIHLRIQAFITMKKLMQSRLHIRRQFETILWQRHSISANIFLNISRSLSELTILSIQQRFLCLSTNTNEFITISVFLQYLLLRREWTYIDSELLNISPE